MSEAVEPMLVSAMRRHPTGEVRHIPGHSVGMCGTTTQGFLGELDELVANARVEGVNIGWAVGHNEACELGDFCSRHQPIGAPARIEALSAALDLAVPYQHAEAATTTTEGNEHG